MFEDAKVGFEFEFISDLNKYRMLELLNKHTKFDFKGTRTFNYSRDDYSEYQLTYDGSLRSHRFVDYHSHELVSPVLSYDQAIADIGALFEFAKEQRDHIEINNYCGFHVNVSIPGMSQLTRDKIRRLYLLEKLDSQKILKQFDRDDNQYVRSHGIEKPLFSEWMFNYLDMQDFVSDSSFLDPYLMDTEKYRTVNFRKLNTNTPYLEFRILGGKDYHLRYSEVISAISRFVECTREAVSVTDFSSVEARKKEIIREIFKKRKTYYLNNDPSLEEKVNSL